MTQQNPVCTQEYMTIHKASTLNIVFPISFLFIGVSCNIISGAHGLSHKCPKSKTTFKNYNTQDVGTSGHPLLIVSCRCFITRGHSTNNQACTHIYLRAVMFLDCDTKVDSLKITHITCKLHAKTPQAEGHVCAHIFNKMLLIFESPDRFPTVDMKQS